MELSAKLKDLLSIGIKSSSQSVNDALNEIETINKNLQLQIAKRKETEKSLLKIQRLYDAVIHNFPEGVIGVLNREMQYVLVDGLDLNEMDLPELGLGELIPSEKNTILTEETISKIKKAFDGERISFEVRTMNRAYGITAVPLTDEHNEVNEILCVFKNITVRKQLEEGLLKSLEKEKELNELKSRFVTMACHEFKSPLTTILSSAFLLENYSEAEYHKEKQVHISRVKRSVNNLIMVLDEFLSLETMHNSDVKMEFSTINIPQHLKELISDVGHSKKKDQVIIYEHSGSRETVYLDSHRLWSIVSNLVSNALKYSDQRATVWLTTSIENNILTIVVKDNGIGIPLNEQPYIFEQFYRAGNALNYNGTGLGLLIVQKNVIILNGSIAFTSTIGVGTEFTVTLPDAEGLIDTKPY